MLAKLLLLFFKSNSCSPNAHWFCDFKTQIGELRFSSRENFWIRHFSVSDFFGNLAGSINLWKIFERQISLRISNYNFSLSVFGFPLDFAAIFGQSFFAWRFFRFRNSAKIRRAEKFWGRQFLGSIFVFSAFKFLMSKNFRSFSSPEIPGPPNF